MAASIICGVDDSESAKEAARVARALAAELRLGLVFVRVVGPDAPDAQVSAIAERLERLSAGSSDVDCGAAWLVEAGQPADCLVTAATEAEAALIVVGSTGPRSSTDGSISADVSRRAPCPVVVVPPGAHTCGADGRREWRERAREDRDYAGGIARLGLGRGGTDFAGGIARFNLGSRVPYDWPMGSELMRWEWEGGAVFSDDDAGDTEVTGDESTDEDHGAYAERDRPQRVGFEQR